MKASWAARWAKVGEQYLEGALPPREGGVLARAEAKALAVSYERGLARADGEAEVTVNPTP